MTKKKDTIEISKDTLKNIIIAILIVVVAIFLFGGFKNNSQPNIAIDDSNAPEAIPSINMKALVDDDAVFGNKDAKVTIVEFSDFECPYCARAYNDALKQVKSEYVEKGLVNIVYRDFPLGFHQNAQKAAEAAECAGEQDKYYEMHDQLFENGVEGGVTSFKTYAKNIGLDTTKFNTCLDSGAMEKEVAKDMADGEKAGVRGTPAFFINGKMISGAQPFAVFKEVIDKALA